MNRIVLTLALAASPMSINGAITHAAGIMDGKVQQGSLPSRSR